MENYEYQFDGAIPQVNIPFFTGWGFFLDLFGQQSMRGPLRLQRGQVWAPSLTFEADNRTGIFSPEPYSLGYAIFGFLRFLVNDAGTTFYNVAGAGGTLAADLLTENQVYQLPNLSGTVALYEQITEDQVLENGDDVYDFLPGHAVYVSGDGEVSLARADADETKLLIGLSTQAISQYTEGIVKVSGVLTLTTGQWDAVTDETGGLTPGVKYYLSNDTFGHLTQTETSVLAGVALSTTRMKIGSLGSGAGVSWTDVTVANSATETITSLTGLYGKILIEDDQEDFCLLRVTPTSMLMLEGADTYVFDNTPPSTKVGLSISGTYLLVSAGSSAGRIISWRYEGP